MSQMIANFAAMCLTMFSAQTLVQHSHLTGNANRERRIGAVSGQIDVSTKDGTSRARIVRLVCDATPTTMRHCVNDGSSSECYKSFTEGR